MASGNSAAPKILGAVFFGLIAGLIWACIETGKSPFAMFRSRTPESKPVAHKPEAKPPVDPPAPIVSGPKKPDPPKVDPVKPPPAKVDPPGVVRMSVDEWDRTRKSLERKLGRGRLEEFQTEIRSVDRKRVPDSGVSDLRKFEERYALYQRLLAETESSKINPPPNLYNFTLINGNEILAKLITKDDRSYYIETLIGIGTRVDKARVKGTPDPLRPEQALARVEMILEGKCDGKGIMRQKKEELITGFFDNPKRSPPPSAMAYFDMADFCAENGLADLIPMLFDLSYEKDSNIVNSVHEIKAARLMDRVRFFDSIQSKEDAMETFMAINSRYYDTSAFAKDRTWLKEKYGTLVRETAPPPPEYKPTPVGDNAGGNVPETAPDTNPVGGDPIASGSKDPGPSSDGRDKVKPGKAPKPAADDKWQRSVSGPISVESAQEHIAKGDASYADGKKHLQNSDSNENPNGWIAENKAALKLMSSAFEEYDTAQVIYEKLNLRIPADLLEKARETNMIRSMCRKRAVTSR